MAAAKARFLAGGRRGLADEPRSGRPPKLNAAALAFLAEALEASPQAYGLPVTVWSIRDLREVLAARLGVRVCTATVHRAVQRLGYRYRRPRHDLRHRQDQEAVAAAEEVLAWRRKKALAPPANSASFTCDECEVHRHPRLAKVWRRRRCPLRVPAAGEDGTFAVFGALDYATGRLVCQTAEHKDGAAFVAFLDHLAAAFPDGPLVVVLDNVGYHKGRRAKDWWMAQQDRVRPLWLPAYAPELNLIERVWRHLKDKLSCHRWWADLPASAGGGRRRPPSSPRTEARDPAAVRPSATRAASPGSRTWSGPVFRVVVLLAAGWPIAARKIVAPVGLPAAPRRRRRHPRYSAVMATSRYSAGSAATAHSVLGTSREDAGRDGRVVANQP